MTSHVKYLYLLYL